MPFQEFLEHALYDPDHGFYRAGGRAGRRGDFLTSPEVGPLFGHVMANALDVEWERLGRPDSFTVVDAGAGPGTLARTVRAAAPACLPALDYVAVETSAAQRASHPEWVRSQEVAPDSFDGVVIANELLDNLPFVPLRRTVTGWECLQVASIGHALHEHWADAPELDVRFPDDARSVVLQSAANSWLADMHDRVERGRIIVIDYCRLRSVDVGIRTYAAHGDAGSPFEHVGLKDITVDVDLQQLQRLADPQAARPATTIHTQAEWLHQHGIDALVAEGREQWQANATVGDLAALRMRSRIREAEALTEASGLGGFHVAEWEIS